MKKGALKSKAYDEEEITETTEVDKDYPEEKEGGEEVETAFGPQLRRKRTQKVGQLSKSLL